MESAIEFILVLLGVSICVLILAGLITANLRKRAHSRRLKRHFASKNQAGRPTQS